MQRKVAHVALEIVLNSVHWKGSFVIAFMQFLTDQAGFCSEVGSSTAMDAKK